ncbi:MAG: hypothetical protein ACK5JR_17245 [Tropicimonas sp.]|uniref:hypothetical protein n=1 Tax=Tropicimonas sp. TaxID=2067044 RepID=UPI003A8641E7
MGFLSSLFRAFSGKKPTVHRHFSKIDKVNAWKVAKKAKGNWLPHDEYVKRKRGR